MPHANLGAFSAGRRRRRCTAPPARPPASAVALLRALPGKQKQLAPPLARGAGGQRRRLPAPRLPARLLGRG